MQMKARLIALATLAALAPLPAAPAASAMEGNGGVLVVGDSLEELTSPYIAEHLPPGTKLTVNAVGGSNSYQIFDLFRESYEPSQSVIVFDAGTNDNPEYPQILAGNLAKVAATIGNRCMVVPTIHGFTVNGVNNAGKNRVVREFAASRPGTQVPDWAGFRASHLELMADELHPGQQGAEARAELIAQGILGCLSGESAFAGESTSGTSSETHAPLLESAPDRIPTVNGMERRQTSILRSMGAAVVGQAAALLLAGAVLGR